MAWVKVITKTGNILTMPQTVYEGMYKENSFYSLFSEPKPFSKPEQKNEGVIEDGELQNNNSNETKPSGKSTKKTSVQRK